MDSIFHEKQEGSLCAQHCLNALLQGPFFTAVELAELASQLDEDERSALEHGCNSSHVSNNMDEAGYFSIQVISKALSIWSLELVPFLRQSSEAESARQHPEQQRAFICNFRKHWFTIRRFGNQWFDLNSTLSKPRLISTTYLNIYLAQLQQEGHSIFFVTGNLPDCEAEQLIALCPVPEDYSNNHERTITIASSDVDADGADDEQMQLAMAICKAEMDEENVSLQRILQSSEEEAQEKELQRALELSKMEVYRTPEDDELQEAIKLSLTAGHSSPATDPPTATAEQVRMKRQAFLDKLDRQHNK
ncbi:hypothetical protein CRM22_009874 [Opisthorchis felineus]|uniref:ubiquitinyl hydrolase 1 n=1 Tax=Opisthorchis felineus TaxID=147828 RepID=A0A4S2LBR2_OPIFE|nr:hypothetical protein CRM22_009874 [Opisthorchis felineus]